VPLSTEADLDLPHSPAIAGGFHDTFSASRCLHRVDPRSPLRAPHHLQRVKSMSLLRALRMLGRSALTIRRLRRVSFSRSPPSVLRSARPLPASAEALTIGPLVPPRESRSAHVVSLHLDGFLRTDGANIVAARSRPWGSPCCCHPSTCPIAPKRAAVSMVGLVSHGALTPRSHSLPAAPAFAHRSPRRRCVHARLLPPCRCTGGTAAVPSAQRRRATHRRLLPSCSTTRSHSADRSVTAVHRFQ
jgi:hypothetical protein